MAQPPLGTTSLIIDDPNVTITKTFAGDLFFRDNFVPGVKLQQLIGLVSGGPLVLDPALIVEVDVPDYTFIPSDNTYAINIPTNFNLNISEQIGIIVKVYDINNYEIGVDTIQALSNSIYMKVAFPETLFVVIKRVV